MWTKFGLLKILLNCAMLHSKGMNVVVTSRYIFNSFYQLFYLNVFEILLIALKIHMDCKIKGTIIVLPFLAVEQ